MRYSAVITVLWGVLPTLQRQSLAMQSQQQDSEPQPVLFDYTTCQPERVRIIDQHVDRQQRWIDWDSFKADYVLNASLAHEHAIMVEVDAVPCAVQGCCNILFSFRYNATDVYVFEQIYKNHSFSDLYKHFQETAPRYIVDAGANAGFASSLFALLLPEAAAIISIEPDKHNFLQLATNARRFANVKMVNAALWSRQTYLDLLASEGEWGLMFKEVPAGRQSAVYATTIPQILQHFNMPRIDVAKIDIEGAESQVFSQEADLLWLNSTQVLCMELHDWMAGYYGLERVSDAVYNAMATRPFAAPWWSGEHVYWVHSSVNMSQ